MFDCKSSNPDPAASRGSGLTNHDSRSTSDELLATGLFRCELRTENCELPYGYIRFSIRGNGIVSRTWSSAHTHATTRSMPMPKPECGTLP